MNNTKSSKNIKNVYPVAEEESDVITINSISCMYLIIYINYLFNNKGL